MPTPKANMLCNSFFKINVFKFRRKINETLSGLHQFQRWKCEKATISRSVANGKLKVLFFGTDAFSLPSLKVLHNKYFTLTEYTGLGVVTSLKNPPNCVRTYAEQSQLPLYRWPVLPEVCREYDLGVVVSFGHLIPEQIIKSFPKGMINVHASLLPRWRGAAPIIYALMHGDKRTGVSIMKIEPKHFDVGDILAQREVVIRDGIFMPELHDHLATEGADLLLNTIKNYASCLESATKQNIDQATFAPKITPAITEVNWPEVSAQRLYQKFRALFGYKNLKTRFQNKTVQLIDIKLPAFQTIPAPLSNTDCGSFFFDRTKRCLLVRCADNTYVEVHKLRIEGKKVMCAMDFNNGFLKGISPTKVLLFTSK